MFVFNTPAAPANVPLALGLSPWLRLCACIVLGAALAAPLAVVGLSLRPPSVVVVDLDERLREQAGTMGGGAEDLVTVSVTSTTTTAVTTSTATSIECNNDSAVNVYRVESGATTTSGGVGPYCTSCAKGARIALPVRRLYLRASSLGPVDVVCSILDGGAVHSGGGVPGLTTTDADQLYWKLNGTAQTLTANKTITIAPLTSGSTETGLSFVNSISPTGVEKRAFEVQGNASAGSGRIVSLYASQSSSQNTSAVIEASTAVGGFMTNTTAFGTVAGGVFHGRGLDLTFGSVGIARSTYGAGGGERGVGMYGVGVRTSANGQKINGGWFRVHNSDYTLIPTFETAALVADVADTAHPAFLVRKNNATTASISGDGVVTATSYAGTYATGLGTSTYSTTGGTSSADPQRPPCSLLANAGEFGRTILIDDSDDAGAARVCICMPATSSPTALSWQRFDDTSTACGLGTGGS